MPRRRYTVEQITKIDRWAWASSTGERPDYFFDGESFWHDSLIEGNTIVRADAVPGDGWWHARNCLCALCGPSRW